MEDHQSFIDSLDELLTSGLQSVCEDILGSYDAREIRAAPLPRRDLLRSASSVTDAIHGFKHAYRSNPSAPLMSRSPSVSVFDDVVAHYTSCFAQPQDDLKLNDSEDVFPRAVGSASLHQWFAQGVVWRAIHQYPLTKSCGADSLHIRILRVMAGSEEAPNSLSKALSFFFQLCVLWGLTPRRWNSAIISLVPKKEDSRMVDGFHPIALTEMF